jgi:hypothetical protein
MIQQFYVVRVEKKDGMMVYLRISDASSPSGYSAATTPNPELARKFPLTAPQDVIQWIERIKSSVGRTCNPNTMKVMVFEMSLREIDDDDSEWNKALRMNAISKLTEQEIVALGLQKHEIERRLNAE